MNVQVNDASPAEVAELADVAATTFPLACPLRAAPEDVAAFIAAHLSTAHFVEHLADPQRKLLVVRAASRIIGYAMMIHDSGNPDIELSKFYVLPNHHGSGASAILMRTALEWAASAGAQRIWLGVNQRNERAQRFYRKQGFEVTGTRTFELGASVEHDFVMARLL